MKYEKLYPIFENYIDDRKKSGKLSAGAAALSKISRDVFEMFKKRIEKNDSFEGKQIESFRDKKIDDIFDDL